MTTQMISAIALSAVLSACQLDQAPPVIQAASDIRLVDQCGEFQALKNEIHARLDEISIDDLRRLSVINAEGLILCTIPIETLIAELKAMRGRLP